MLTHVWSHESDGFRCKPMTSSHGFVEALALSQDSQEPTCKGVTGSVGVNNLAGINLVDVVDSDLDISVLLCLSDNGGVRSLCDNHDSLLLGVLLWQSCQVLCNLLYVLCLQP